MQNVHMQQWSAREETSVSETATRVARGHDGESRVWVRYDLRGWIVDVGGETGAPFDGPSEVTVRLDLSDEGLDSLEAGGAGITAEVLRSVPLGDARKVLRRLKAELLSRRDEHVYDLPGRMVSLDDWAKFARAYARSAARNPSQPIAHLARAADLSVNTIAARLRRAQELGLLEDLGEPGRQWLVLTEAARDHGESPSG